MDQTSVEFTKIFVIHTYQIGKIDIVAIFRLLRPSSQFTEVSNTLFKFAPLKQNIFKKLRRCHSPTGLQFEI